MRPKGEPPRTTTPELRHDPAADPAGAPSWALPFDAARPPSVQLLRHGRYRDLRGVFAGVRLHGAGSTVEAHPPPTAASLGPRDPAGERAVQAPERASLPPGERAARTPRTGSP